MFSEYEVLRAFHHLTRTPATPTSWRRSSRWRASTCPRWRVRCAIWSSVAALLKTSRWDFVMEIYALRRNICCLVYFSLSTSLTMGISVLFLQSHSFHPFYLYYNALFYFISFNKRNLTETYMLSHLFQPFYLSLTVCISVLFLQIKETSWRNVCSLVFQPFKLSYGVHFYLISSDKRQLRQFPTNHVWILSVI